jgi:hypothetical protein
MLAGVTFPVMTARAVGKTNAGGTLDLPATSKKWGGGVDGVRMPP